MKTKITITHLSILLTLLLPTFGWACTCMTALSIADKISKASHIFHGTIIANPNVQTPQKSTKLMVTEDNLTTTYYLSVKEALKGEKTKCKVIKITTPSSSAMCGTTFEIGTTYIVFANSNLDDKTYRTNLCMNNQTYNKEDAKAIKKQTK